ncbi:YihY/virulence factor BrkB family protein [Alicyclobacillus sp.]|uniref:YihY/virulence factor BrkB family protein n=1 Tax=Alicyclobacillus sp. TaxID=61169 RepID=UPI0025C5FAF7|nr:YihY/virulence factor BrkB family protein [Alicyclobacillus sp.]MCL6515674.1 YihY/virulence factor BrkB family protein [Alicyclobacillus sp.]
MTRPAGRGRGAWLQGVGRGLWALAMSVARHDIASLAAVISFYAFFSLFPLLVLIIYTVSRLVPDAQIAGLLTSLLHSYFPAMREETQVIEGNIGWLSAAGARVGVLSAATLLWSATSGFIAVQQAMDVIWECPQRSFFARRWIAFLMLCVLTCLGLGSALVMTLYPAMRHFIADKPALAVPLSVLHGLSRVVFPLSLFLAFAISYRYLPSRKPPWVALVPGALTAALLLDQGRQLFVWYAGLAIGRYQLVYGTLTAVMLFLLWLYVGSIVMLFGVEVACAIDRALEDEDAKDGV